MKEMLGPLGLHLPAGAIAHEKMRKHLERVLNAHSSEYHQLAQQTGYDTLTIPTERAPLWWAHLVMVYFKRRYCNMRDPAGCPIRANQKVSKYLGRMCDRAAPESGGYRCITIEGIDQVGKSTVAEELKRMGYAVVHSTYHPDHKDIGGYYRRLINLTPPPVALDRTFISEVAYGAVLRGGSRISWGQFQDLLLLLAEKGYAILYLTEREETVRRRLLASPARHGEVLSNLAKLIAYYGECMDEAARYVPVYRLSPATVSRDRLLSHILEAMNA